MTTSENPGNVKSGDFLAESWVRSEKCVKLTTSGVQQLFTGAVPIKEQLCVPYLALKVHSSTLRVYIPTLRH